MISIHAPLAGCDLQVVKLINVIIISIHAPLAGCDGTDAEKDAQTLFQSTHPSRGATAKEMREADAVNFNPRTPRGVRRYGRKVNLTDADVNPRTPRGERLD